MNITDLAKLRTALDTTPNGTASSRVKEASTDPITKALDQATARLDQQKQSAEVKLSAYGQVKSATSDLEISSRALGKVATSETASEARKIAQNFVNAYNNARTVANKAINGTQTPVTGSQSSSGNTQPDATAGSLSGDNRARVTANELSRAITPSTGNDLKALGITTNSDGTLKLDTQKFEQAFAANPQQAASTLNDAGREVEQTASRQLSSNGNVSRSIDNLSRQVQTLDSQQQNQQNLIDALRQNSEQANARLNAISATGIAAYQKILSL